MPNLGPWELVIVVGIITMLFGAKRLPQLARSLAHSKSEFRKALAEDDSDDDEAMKASVKESPSASDENQKPKRRYKKPTTT